MKLETIPNETWVERQLRAMDVIMEKACASPEASVSYMLKAKMISAKTAKKYGYSDVVKKIKSKK